MLVARPNSGKLRFYTCRCTVCEKETPRFDLTAVPGWQGKPEELEPLFQTLLGGKLLPEPQGERNRHLQAQAEQMVDVWRLQLKRKGCPHHYRVVSVKK